MFLFWFSQIYHNRLANHSFFFYLSLQSNSFSSSIWKERNTKTYGLITLSKYPMNYLELPFVLTNFEISILSTLTFQIFTGNYAP